MAFLLQKASNLVTHNLEKAFFWWGQFVSRRPYPVICSCLVITAISSLGFLNFRMEHEANRLWINSDSSYNFHEAWLRENFRKNERSQFITVRSDNVLEPAVISRMFDVYKKIQSITSHGKRFSDVCATVPIADIFQNKRRRKRQAPLDDDQYDYSEIWGQEYYDEVDEDHVEVEEVRINFQKYGRKANNTSDDTKEHVEAVPDSIYCDLVTTLNEKCIQTSLLEMWRYREDFIRSTTQEEILAGVNLLERSPWYGYSSQYQHLLGGVTRNATGHIVSAKTAYMIWTLKVPDGVEFVSKTGLEIDPADVTTIDWERQFLEIALNMSTSEVQLLPNAVSSFSDISSEAVFFDIYLILIGYFAMFFYTITMLGKINTVEIRLYVTIAGIVSVFMGLVISVSLASIFGFPYTTMHAALPFLCLGIGIDDMFVIVQCLNNLIGKPDYSTMKIETKLGMALRHAGVSVTVTTATDVVAFSVGAVTQMPGLQSFCVCTSIALASIYILQLSWFTAWLALDERRKEAGRDGVVPCLVHPQDYTPLGCSLSNTKLSARLSSLYERVTHHWLYKLLVLVISAGFLSCGITGWASIVHRFDPVLLLPAESYLRQWVDLQTEFYPENGWQAEIYSERLDQTDLDKVEELVNELEALKQRGDIIREYDCWWTPFKTFVEESKNVTGDVREDIVRQFPSLLSEFLHSAEGARYKSDFQFSRPLQCGQPAPNITASKCKIDYFHFDGPDTHIPARLAVTDTIKNVNSAYFFSHSKVYSAWETDEIIGHELLRNLLLSILSVAIITLLLLGNVFVCIIVLVMVIVTLVDIVGFLHFWGITVDILSAVNIVLAIGLCVDYAVHIAHAYLMSTGSSQQRATSAVKLIGAAVVNGGTTTFLALLFCGISSSHVYQTFFKVSRLHGL